MSNFSGVCIGGPEDGREYVKRLPRFSCMERPPMPTVEAMEGPMPADASFKRREYTHMMFHFSDGNCGVWAHESLPTRFHVLKYILQNYAQRALTSDT